MTGSKNGKAFVRLTDGESVRGIFQGDPVVFWVLWKGQRSFVVPETTPESRPRFKMNFVTQENGQLVAKVFEGSMTLYRQLKELHEEYDLSKTMVKITRNGTGKETVYSILPAREPVDKVAMKRIQNVQLQDLTTKLDPMLPGEVPSDSDPDLEEMLL